MFIENFIYLESKFSIASIVLLFFGISQTSKIKDGNSHTPTSPSPHQASTSSIIHVSYSRIHYNSCGNCSPLRPTMVSLTAQSVSPCWQRARQQGKLRHASYQRPATDHQEVPPAIERWKFSHAFNQSSIHLTSERSISYLSISYTSNSIRQSTLRHVISQRIS